MREQTHYQGCWNDRGHERCAYFLIEQLKNALEINHAYLSLLRHRLVIPEETGIPTLSSLDRALGFAEKAFVAARERED